MQEERERVSEGGRGDIEREIDIDRQRETIERERERERQRQINRRTKRQTDIERGRKREREITRGKKRKRERKKRKKEIVYKYKLNYCNLLSGGSESLLLSVCSRVLRVIVELQLLVISASCTQHTVNIITTVIIIRTTTKMTTTKMIMILSVVLCPSIRIMRIKHTNNSNHILTITTYHQPYRIQIVDKLPSILNLMSI